MSKTRPGVPTTTWTPANRLSASSLQSLVDARTLLELGHVLANIRATDTSHALNVHVVAQSDDDLLDLLSQLTSGCENERLRLLEADIDALKNGN